MEVYFILTENIVSFSTILDVFYGPVWGKQNWKFVA